MLYHYYSGVTRLLLRCICLCSPLDYVIVITLSLLHYHYYVIIITLSLILPNHGRKLLVFWPTGTYYGSCCFITCHQWPDIVSMGVNSQNKGGGAAPVFFTLDPPSKIISLQIWATSKLKFTFLSNNFFLNLNLKKNI